MVKMFFKTSNQVNTKVKSKTIKYFNQIMDFSLLTSQSQFPACLFCVTSSVWGVCGDFFTGQNDELTI